MITGTVKVASLILAMSTGAAAPLALGASKHTPNFKEHTFNVAGEPSPPGTVVGAFPAPPTGAGSGTLAVWQTGTGIVRTVRFASANTSAGNSFYVAADPSGNSVFVPTAAGTTYVVSTRSWKVTGQFTSITGGRVAKVTPDGGLLIVESPTQTAAYLTTAPYQQVFSTSTGGNALVVTPEGNDAFVGGNADPTITEIALPSGRLVSTFNVSHSGDMVWARGQLFSANIATGVMSAINPATSQIVDISTPEVDPSFSYADIPAATAGFMQLAVSPGQSRVYAAGFSGHILSFSTTSDTYLGEISVNANAAAPGKNLLSGLAVLPGGQQAVVTVENLQSSVVVSLATGKIIKSASSLASNRWISLQAVGADH